MAVIEVTGTVARIFYNGKGVSIAEPYKTATGEVKQRKYTAWFTAPVDFREGVTGTFKGTLSTKIELWQNADGTPKLDNTGKQGQSVTVSINDAVFTAISSQLPAAVGAKVASGDWYPVKADDVWATEAKFVQDTVNETLDDLPF